MKLIQVLVHCRNRELILGCFVIQRPIVDAKVLGSVCLFDKKHQCREWGSTSANGILFLHGSTLPLELDLLKMWVAVRVYNYWRHAWKQVDLVVVGVCQGKFMGLI
jgi:hypothetical protein